MENTEKQSQASDQEQWNLIITTRKKWYDLQLSSPSPAFFWRRGRDKG
jgi:hypothetical protein